MTKDRLIHLRDNCSKDYPDLSELKELFEHILNREIPDGEHHMKTLQAIVLQYVDNFIEV